MRPEAFMHLQINHNWGITSWQENATFFLWRSTKAIVSLWSQFLLFVSLVWEERLASLEQTKKVVGKRRMRTRKVYHRQLQNAVEAFFHLTERGAALRSVFLLTRNSANSSILFAPFLAWMLWVESQLFWNNKTYSKPGKEGKLACLRAYLTWVNLFR